MNFENTSVPVTGAAGNPGQAVAAVLRTQNINVNCVLQSNVYTP